MKIFVMIICLIAPMLLTAQTDAADFEGKVSGIVVKNYGTMDDKEKFANRVEYVFNERGNVLKMFEYAPRLEEKMPEYQENPDEYTNDEIFYQVIVNKYDENGLIKKSFRNERSTYNDRIVQYHRDENGNDTLVESYSMEGVIIHTMKNEFDEKGNLVKWIEHDIKNDRVASTGKIKYEYYDNGSIKKKMVDSASWERAVPKFVVVYDQRERPTERYHLTEDKTKIPHYKKIYGTDHIKEKIVYDDGAKVIRYTYNEDGKMLSMEKFKNDGDDLQWKRSISYNEHGDKSGMELLQTRGSITINWDYTYTYDENGNWLTRRESEKGRPYRLVRREITYFDE